VLRGFLNLPVSKADAWKVDSAKFFVLPVNIPGGGPGPFPKSFDCDLTPQVNPVGMTFFTLLSAKLPQTVPDEQFGEFTRNSDVSVWYEVTVSDGKGGQASTFTVGATTVKAKALTRPK
jgi:hypothetical protein